MNDIDQTAYPEAGFAAPPPPAYLQALAPLTAAEIVAVVAVVAG